MIWERFIKKREAPTEKIVAAAIQYRSNTGIEIFQGQTHQEAVEMLERKYPEWAAEDYERYEDGFLTDTKRFVGKKEAGKIARAAGQLDHLSDEQKKEATGLLHTFDTPFPLRDSEIK